jgi:fibronectin type 3 domain-containing protein
LFNQILTTTFKSDFAMKLWEKSKKDTRRSDERELQQTSQKKKKLKPVEKTKYRLKGFEEEED